MVAYTNYLTDARVRLEAETLTSLPDYKVLVMVLKESSSPRTYSINGVEVRELNTNKYRGENNIRYLISYCIFLLLAFWTCNKLFWKNSLDIVHIHNMPNFIVFSAIIPYLFGRKIILDIHDTVIETYATKFRGIAHRIMPTVLYLEEYISCKLAHKIICVNHIQRDTLIKRGIPENKIIISMNIPDPKRFSYNRNVIHHSSKKKFRMIYFGTISKRLGIDLAIQAVSKLVNNIPGLEFHILGTGDDLQEFINLTEKLGVEKSILFYKKVFPLEKLIEILDEMDMCVIPNRKNSATELMLPVKLLECVALGIPVVAPKLKTIEYYFSDDMLFYFEPDNIDSLVNTIMDAFNTESKRINKAENAKRFLKEYGWETHQFELINLYKSLLVN